LNPNLISAVLSIGLMSFGCVLWRILTWMDRSDRRFGQIDYRARSLAKKIDDAERERYYAELRFSRIERRFNNNATTSAADRQNAARFTPGEPHPFAVDAFITIGADGALPV
jgi:hypothetical protein